MTEVMPAVTGQATWFTLKAAKVINIYSLISIKTYMLRICPGSSVGRARD